MKRIGTRRQVLRLPQDVPVAGGRPALPTLEMQSQAVLSRAHDDAVRGGDFQARARACWALVDQGAASLDWVWANLHGPSPDYAADAAGVLGWIGVPREWRDELESFAETLPDGEQRDSLREALGHAEAEPELGAGQDRGDQLLGGAWLPFTEPIWFVKAPFEQAAEEVGAWTEELGWFARRLRNPLTKAIGQLEPWAEPSWKSLLVGTTGEWTALFSQGSDIGTADVIGRRLKVPSLRTHYAPHVVRGGRIVSNGDCAFWLHGNESGLADRTIQASYQSRWDWHLQGEPLDFEDLALYAARRIKHRLDVDVLNRYCLSLGIRRFDEAFYTDGNLLVEHDLSQWVRKPTNTLSAAQWRERNL